jgi:hypothetical protein
MNPIALPLEDELRDRIDEARGAIPRTVWIRMACEEVLAGPNPHFPGVASEQAVVEALSAPATLNRVPASAARPAGSRSDKFCSHPLSRRQDGGVCGMCNEKVK